MSRLINLSLETVLRFEQFRSDGVSDATVPESKYAVWRST